MLDTVYRNTICPVAPPGSGHGTASSGFSLGMGSIARICRYRRVAS